MEYGKNLVHLFVLLSLAALVEACAHFKMAPTRNKKSAASKELTFADHDFDGDGRLNREEAEAAYARSFGKLDKDGNGYLSRIELGPNKKRFEELDSDGDDRISIIEYMRSFDRHFSDADSNGDGHLDREEAAKFGIPK